MGEQTPQDPQNPHISVEFDQKDLSAGTARYWHDRPVTKNYSIHPTVKGAPPNLNLHSNVEVHFFDEHGKEVHMTKRMVRTWNMVPEQNASVDSLSQWRAVGLDSGSPFITASRSEVSNIPVQMSRRNFKLYGPTNFTNDRRGKLDSPGFTLTSAREKPTGQLQEFLAGNEKVGGVYFQTYVILDSQGNGRVINATKVILSPSEYRDVLKKLASGEYKRTHLTKLMFDARQPESDERFNFQQQPPKVGKPKHPAPAHKKHPAPYIAPLR